MGVHFFHRAVARRRQNGHLSVGDDSFALLPGIWAAGRAGPGHACRPVYCRYAQMPSAMHMRPGVPAGTVLDLVCSM